MLIAAAASRGSSEHIPVLCSVPPETTRPPYRLRDGKSKCTPTSSSVVNRNLHDDAPSSLSTPIIPSHAISKRTNAPKLFLGGGGSDSNTACPVTARLRLRNEMQRIGAAGDDDDEEDQEDGRIGKISPG
ncbi:hypothetical protein VTL71DRAFT_6718 [Oculimacula yallundae]|uniref:Uncharacterized protein n=1 Tax=Oculimacula yallundae TaxID=86028 RepID=A0ABR4BXV7_9HELO